MVWSVRIYVALHVCIAFAFSGGLRCFISLGHIPAVSASTYVIPGFLIQVLAQRPFKTIDYLSHMN